MKGREVIRHQDGGVRERRVGKGAYKWISTVALRRLAQRYEYGGVKYDVGDDYKKGLPASDCWDSAIRHLVEWIAGNDNEDHLAAAVWNIFCIIEMEENNPRWIDIDSRPTTVRDYNDDTLSLIKEEDQ